MRAFHITRIVALQLALLGPSALAQVQDARPSEQAEQGGIFSLIPPDAITEHDLKLGSDMLPYTATAGTIDLFSQNGQRSAQFFTPPMSRRTDRSTAH